ncbi:cell division protein FtsX [Pontivivens nitratireducens]|uniref:Cell division protein FtsX n=1 Tax=Pontivivens nitratireducens TaxID=2758038 RepID=A0A6G7VKK4_9RHOB|nr:FtsX-like permease family protein [Pontibrevibacter nitratireducens]QIK40396.1 cell division protein FtsX [Pontibrevibacter nitratireducens]
MKLHRLLSGGAADGIVPTSGFTAWLVSLVSLAMAALGVAALAVCFATDRLADRWSAELARSSTVTIMVPEGQMDAQAEAALIAVRTTPGIQSARLLSEEEQSALLAPWLGSDLTLDVLPVPRVIVMEETVAGPDADSLRLRLEGEAPDAVYDDHTRWRRPMVAAAQRLRLFGLGALGLIALATAGMITLAAQASLAANEQIIGTLRLIGAQDNYIAGAFVRRFTLRALGGGVAGTVLAALGLLFMPDMAREAAFVTRLGPQGAQWALLLTVPLIAAATAFIATRMAAFRALRHLEDR